MEIDYIWIQRLNLESTILPYNIVENFEVGCNHSVLENNMISTYIFIYKIYSMIGNDRNWHGEIK